ncbi:pentatricopeptide repeat-containing protein At4g21065-like [Nymphaea colorata]|nr:pentatricopeptide repeat-containing protein At4g21065-like [Nymphaea colorata]
MLRAVTSCRALLICLTRAHHSACVQNPSWVSENKLFSSHPRLQILEQCQSLGQLKEVLCYIITAGLSHDHFAMSRVLYFCAITSPNLDFACLVFSQIERPNSFSWNTMIRGFVSSGQPVMALSLYSRMLRDGMLPDKYTYPFLFKACGSLARNGLVLGRSLHCHVLELGYALDLYVLTGTMHMYGLLGCLGEATKVFDNMPQRDVASWTSLITCYVANDCWEEGLLAFNLMRDDCVKPNSATLVCVMGCCAQLGALDQARCLHSVLEKLSIKFDVFVGNSLVDLYSKCGRIDYACQAFDEMPNRDSFSWTAMIAGLAMHGLIQDALDTFSQMKHEGAEPDAVTFVAILGACSHAGLVNEGLKYFACMKKEHKIVPDVKHYGCMVDLLSRAGLLDNALDFIRSMPADPGLAVWGALLSACRLHSNIEVGELAAKEIESLPDFGGAHVLLSNIYANASQWDAVSNLRHKMGDQDTRKPPGYSSIELRGVVHAFFVGDRTHPQSHEIYHILDDLTLKLKLHDCVSY